MENKKQSSIEWLIKEIENRNGIIDSETDPYVKGSMIHFGYEDLYKEAKEKHKQEIIDACEEFGNLNGVDIEDYTEYYNQNFNK